jgi:hypothetical protein
MFALEEITFSNCVQEPWECATFSPAWQPLHMNKSLALPFLRGQLGTFSPHSLAFLYLSSRTGTLVPEPRLVSDSSESETRAHGVTHICPLPPISAFLTFLWEADGALFQSCVGAPLWGNALLQTALPPPTASLAFPTALRFSFSFISPFWFLEKKVRGAENP